MGGRDGEFEWGELRGYSDGGGEEEYLRDAA